MKKLTLAVAIAASLSSAAHAQVSQATLYPNGGVLTWEEPQSIEKGSGIFTVSGLPVGLEDSTLQAGLEGLSGVEIQKVSIVRKEQAQTISEEMKAIEADQENVDSQIKRLNNAGSIWGQQLRLVNQVAESPGDEITPENLVGLSDKMLEISKRSYGQLEEIQDRLKTLNKEKDLLERKANQVAAGAKATKSVEISYRSEGSGDALVNLSFRTPHVGWRSEYNARLDSDSGRIEVEHKALIRQQSGIDWSNVKLSLATANQRLGATTPPIHPWEIHRRNPQVARSTMNSMAMSAQMDMIKPVQENTGALKSIRSFSQATLQNDGSKTQSYQVSGSVSLPSQSSDQSILIAKHDMESELKTHLYPAMTNHAYVVAHATYKGDVKLPSSRVTLYRDGQMIGPWMMPVMAPGEDVEIGFGVDDRVSVETATKEDERGVNGIYDKENFWKRHRVYTVTNHYQTPVDVRVIERMPVSRHEDISVSYYSVTEPYIKQLDDKEGIIAWDRTIKAGGSVDLNSGFELEVPDDQEIYR